MIQKSVIHKRAQAVEHYLNQLDIYAKLNKDDFFSSEERVVASQRYLHLCIEALCDIGNHIISFKKLGDVDVSRDIPRILAKNSIISETLSTNWLQMIGFRNILVHSYLDIDTEIVYEVITKNLSDIKSILNKFLEII